MFFSEINPYIRYARMLKVDSDSRFDDVVARDARLFYQLNGPGKINVKNKEYIMSRSSLIIINPGTPYKIIKTENPTLYIAINFDYTKRALNYSTPILPVAPDEFKKELLVDYCTFDDAPELSDVLYIDKIPSLEKHLKAIVDEQVQKLLYYESRTGHILAQCLADSMRFMQTDRADAQKETANRILTYIHENSHTNLSNHLIGNVFSYHPNYINSLVKQFTGMSVHQYTLHVRLTNAANLLENSTLSCEEIAQACGFFDLSHFSKCFKNHFGVNPSKYKII